MKELVPHMVFYGALAIGELYGVGQLGYSVSDPANYHLQPSPASIYFVALKILDISDIKYYDPPSRLQTGFGAFLFTGVALRLAHGFSLVKMDIKTIEMVQKIEHMGCLLFGASLTFPCIKPKSQKQAATTYKRTYKTMKNGCLLANLGALAINVFFEKSIPLTRLRDSLKLSAACCGSYVYLRTSYFYAKTAINYLDDKKAIKAWKSATTYKTE